MNELIQQLQQKAGLTLEQANISLHTIKQFVVEKFPMLAGAVDNIFPAAQQDSTMPPTTPTATTTPATNMDTTVPPLTGTTPHTTTTTPMQEESSFLDKISDYIPGQAGQSIEDFAKKAAHEASDFFKKK